ncbi:MAG: selenocysteine-specific translation elongation factor [Pirellulaceae bacterium]
MTYTIVGVTGHIDHGKSTLVRVLTGIDTDTAPEEKRRGITIDLGFAACQIGDHRFAFIDAPGHQKYIGNLLAGVSAIDLCLLVVACDQGIQQQTLEHAAVVRALGVRRLIVVISRIDLATDSTIAELSEELEVFLADFEFEELSIVPISSVTLDGIAQLQTVMCEYASRSAPSFTNPVAQASRDFRLPIDRVFHAPGRGLVVAGTVWSGKVSIGDSLQVARTGEVLRVRELEVHGEPTDSSSSGYRTALNLAGGSHSALERGDELITPGTHPVSNRWVVDLEIFPESSELHCPAIAQLYTATQCCSARILGIKRIAPGQRAIVVVEPERPVVATYLQACLFRRPYPIGSFASGRVLAATHLENKKTKELKELGQRLRNASTAERLLAWIDFLGEMEQDASWCANQLAASLDQFNAVVETLVTNQSIIQLGTRLVAVSAAQRVRKFVLKTMAAWAQTSEDVWLVESSLIDRTQSAGSAALITYVIAELVDEQLLVKSNNLLALPSEQTTLSKKQRASMQQIISLFSDTRSPPTLSEAAQQLGLSVDLVNSIMRFATQQKTFINLGKGFHISTQVFAELCRELQGQFTTETELSVAAIRDRWRVTRKHAIPLLEYCDQEAITVRRGIMRVAGPRLAEFADALGKSATAVQNGASTAEQNHAT